MPSFIFVGYVCQYLGRGGLFALLRPSVSILEKAISLIGLKCDVLLLAGIFEKFRDNSLKNDGFHRSHFSSAPALSWDGMLNIAKVKLELIPDPGIYIFFEKGQRAGVSHISNRYSKAKNKYLKSCDPKQESKHIIYLDANNLYGFAISKFFPTSGFKWIDPKEFDLDKYTSISSRGSVLKFDLEYSKELRDLYNDCPLAPDKKEIKTEMSDYQLKIADLYNILIGNITKLVPNFSRKKNM